MVKSRCLWLLNKVIDNKSNLCILHLYAHLHVLLEVFDTANKQLIFLIHVRHALFGARKIKWHFGEC